MSIKAAGWRRADDMQLKVALVSLDLLPSVADFRRRERLLTPGLVIVTAG